MFSLLFDDFRYNAKEMITMAKTTTKAPEVPKQNPLLAKQLKEMKDRWNKAKQESSKPGGGGGTTLSASAGGVRHVCKLTAAKLYQGDKGTQIILEFTSVEGDEIGEKAVRWLDLFTDEKLIWAQRDLRKLGVDVDDMDPDSLPQMCEDLVEAGPTVRITCKENGEYVNVYIDKQIQVEETQTEEAATEPTAETMEEPAETTEETPAEDQLSIGDDVTYKLKGKSFTGILKKVIDEETVEIKDDDTKKLVSVDISRVQKLAQVE